MMNHLYPIDDNLITYNEWCYNKVGLFNALTEINQHSFLSDYGVENLDLVFKMLYGNRIVSNSIIKLSVNELAIIIDKTFSDSWIKNYETVSELELGISHGTTDIETVTEDRKSDRTNKTINNVSAFNDDSEVYDTSNEDVESNNDKVNKKVEHVTKHTDNKILEQQLKEFNNSFVLSVVMEDIKNFITLEIY